MLVKLADARKAEIIVTISEHNVEIVKSLTDFWLAVDKNGEVWAYTTEKPYRELDYWDTEGDSEAVGTSKPDNNNWASTLTFVACIEDIEVKDEPKEEGVATCLIAPEVKVRCPHCEEIQDGFIGDPRGGTFECDSCEKEYTIHKEADIEMEG